MKTTDKNITPYNMTFNTEYPFICGTTETMKDVAKGELSKLDAEGKIVLITDPYLFNDSDTDYIADLKDILLSLKATKIRFIANSVKNNTTFQEVQQDLQTNGCVMSFESIASPIHDRFWLCSETDKCVIFGTSLNGLCKRICRIDTLKTEEIAELKRELKNIGIDL